MIKKIYGEDNGLILKTEENRIFLRPSKKRTLTVYSENRTEYDMHLYVSFTCPLGLKIEKKELDVFVPAEGNSRFEIPLFVSDDEKIFIGCSALEFSVTDRALEWTCGYEITLFTENTFACGVPFDFSPRAEMLFSHNGEIFMDKNEAVLLEVASFDDENITAEVVDGEKPQLFVNKMLTDDVISLKKGCTRLCIRSGSSGCRIAFRRHESNEKICLNTINPKYFL